MGSNTRLKFVIGGCGLMLIVLVALGVVGGMILAAAGGVFTVPPAFTSAEALAYGVVSEWPGAEMIEVVQSQQSSGLRAVIIRYQQDGESHMDMILTEAQGREFLVASTTNDRAAADESLTANSGLRRNPRDDDVVVYGQILDPAIGRVVVTWPNGWQQEANVVDGTFLWLQNWSPMDGPAQPSAVTAYYATGGMATELQLSIEN